MSASPLQENLGKDSLSAQVSKSQAAVWLSRYLFFMAIATLLVMALGSATRVMNAGLSCPDWPLCYGELVPLKEMDLLVFLEWFHRVLATSMGTFTLILVGTAWWFRAQLPSWTFGSTVFALVLVICQGILGGLTVTQLLRFDIVTAHLATGLLFFSTLLTAATLLALPPRKYRATASNITKWLGLGAVVSVYCQSILGALVSSQWAVHQCLSGTLCGVLHNHFFGVVPASILSLAVVYISWRDRSSSLIGWAGLAVAALLTSQIALGVTTYRLQLQVPGITVLHQVIGAVLLGALIIFTVASFRDLKDRVGDRESHQPQIGTNWS
jgi:heme a synthase